jgi:membrane protein
LTLVLAGPSIAEYLDERANFGSAFRWTWLVVQWPLAFLLVSTALGTVYYFGPDAEQDWVWVTPGALVATTLWLLASLAFKVYISMFTDYNASYGAVGGVIVVLLWFYVSSIAVLLGAELNAEIEHASPYGKEPGMKTQTGRRVLGLRAERLFKGAPDRVAAPEPPPIGLLPAAPRAASSMFGAMIAGPVIALRLWRKHRGVGHV